LHYFGGKARIAKDIAARITGDGHKVVVEPFCGGLNVTAALVQAGAQVVALDGNLALINMYKAYESGWRPPATVSEEEYRRLKETKDPKDPMTAFAGFACSFSGRYFEGYARSKRGDDYVAQATRGLVKKFNAIGPHGAWIEHCDYRNLPIFDGWAIYADPPYANVTPYSGMPKWDSAEFWETADRWALTSTVYVSVKLRTKMARARCRSIDSNSTSARL